MPQIRNSKRVYPYPHIFNVIDERGVYHPVYRDVIIFLQPRQKKPESLISTRTQQTFTKVEKNIPAGHVRPCNKVKVLFRPQIQTGIHVGNGWRLLPTPNQLSSTPQKPRTDPTERILHRLVGIEKIPQFTIAIHLGIDAAIIIPIYHHFDPVIRILVTCSFLSTPLPTTLLKFRIVEVQ